MIQLTLDHRCFRFWDVEVGWFLTFRVGIASGNNLIEYIPFHRRLRVKPDVKLRWQGSQQSLGVYFDDDRLG